MYALSCFSKLVLSPGRGFLPLEVPGNVVEGQVLTYARKVEITKTVYSSVRFCYSPARQGEFISGQATFFYLLDNVTLGRISKCADRIKIKIEIEPKPKFAILLNFLQASFLSNICQSGWR